MTVVAKGVTTDAVESYYETPYRLSPIPRETVAGWRDPVADDALALPEPNPFVPGDLALVDTGTPELKPVRIASRSGFDLWHQADIEFRQPRTNFYFAVRSPIVNDSPRHAVLSALLTRMANDALNEFAYPAALAGQTYSLYRHRRGISVRLSGWSDKQELLLARIASTLREPPLPEGRFEAEKAEYARQLRNVDERRPSRRAITNVRELLIDPYWSDDALSEALETVEVDELREYAVAVLRARRDRRSRPWQRHRRGREGARRRAGARAARFDATDAGVARPSGSARARCAPRPMGRERAPRPRHRRLSPGTRAQPFRAGDDGGAGAGDGKPFLPRASHRTKNRIHRLRDPAAAARSAGYGAGGSIPVGPARGPSSARGVLHPPNRPPRSAACRPRSSSGTGPRWRAI